jgi:hypothetical protein
MRPIAPAASSTGYFGDMIARTDFTTSGGVA